MKTQTQTLYSKHIVLNNYNKARNYKKLALELVDEFLPCVRETNYIITDYCHTTPWYVKSIRQLKYVYGVYVYSNNIRNLGKRVIYILGSDKKEKLCSVLIYFDHRLVVELNYKPDTILDLNYTHKLYQLEELHTLY